MAKVKLANIISEVLWERCLINQRSIQLEHTLTEEQKTRGIFKEYVTYVKNTTTTEQFSLFQNILAPNLTEDMSDDDMADLIAQAAQELASKLPDAQYLTDPENIDVNALEKGDVENGIKIDGEETQTESYQSNARLLVEGGVLMTILAGPAIGKLIANIIDWVKRNVEFPSVESLKEAEIIDILILIHASAKANNKIPSKQDVVALTKKTTFDKLDKMVAFINKSGTEFKSPNIKTPIYDMYSFYPNPDAVLNENIDIAFDRIAAAVKADAEKQKKAGKHSAKFSSDGTQAQPVDKHMLHILEGMTWTSSTAKWLADKSHTAHKWILKIVGTVMTPIFAVRYGLFSKNGWKKAWDKSHEWANVMYIAAMGLYLGATGIKALLSDSNVIEFIKNAFESVEKFIEAAKDTIKIGDLSVAAVEEFIAISGALQED
jgi:hypothetical protein